MERGLRATEAPGSNNVCATKDKPMKVEQTINLSVAVSVRLTQGTRNSHRNSPLSTCIAEQTADRRGGDGNRAPAGMCVDGRMRGFDAHRLQQCVYLSSHWIEETVKRLRPWLWYVHHAQLMFISVWERR